MRLCPSGHGLIFFYKFYMMKKVFIAFVSILSLAFVSCSDLTSSGGGSSSFFDKWWKLSEVYDEENGWYDVYGYETYCRFGSDGIMTVYDGDMTEYPFTYDSKTHTITPESGEPAVVSLVSGELILDIQDGYDDMYKFVQESPFDTPANPDDNPDVPSVEESGIVGKWVPYQYNDGDGWYDATGGDDVVTEFTSSGIVYGYEDGMTVMQGTYSYSESTDILEMVCYMDGEEISESYTVISITSSEMVLAYSRYGYITRIKFRRV